MDEEQMYLSQVPKPLPSRFQAKSVSRILDRLFIEKGYAAEQSRELICEQWELAVGKNLSSRSKVGQIRRGILNVFAANEIVRSELEFQKSKALQCLQTALPAMQIKGVKILVERRS